MTNARPFATKQQPPQLELFAPEEALGGDGCLEALALEGYAARSRRRPELLQRSLFIYLEAL